MLSVKEILARWAFVLLLVPPGLAAYTSTAPRLATTQGPFLDLAQPGPCVIDSAGRIRCWGGARRVELGVAAPKRLLSARDWVCAQSASGALSAKPGRGTTPST